MISAPPPHSSFSQDESSVRPRLSVSQDESSVLSHIDQPDPSSTGQQAIEANAQVKGGTLVKLKYKIEGSKRRPSSTAQRVSPKKSPKVYRGTSQDDDQSVGTASTVNTASSVATRKISNRTRKETRFSSVDSKPPVPNPEAKVDSSVTGGITGGITCLTKALPKAAATTNTTTINTTTSNIITSAASTRFSATRRSSSDGKRRRSYVTGKKIDSNHEQYTLAMGMMLGLRTALAVSQQRIARDVMDRRGRLRGNSYSSRLVRKKEISSSRTEDTIRMKPSDFRATINLPFPPRGSPSTPSHNLAHTFKFKSYAPLPFRRLRSLANLSETDYLLSICGNTSYIDFVSNAKSGQFFFYSDDGRFMIKTMTATEEVSA